MVGRNSEICALLRSDPVTKMIVIIPSCVCPHCLMREVYDERSRAYSQTHPRVDGSSRDA